MGFLKRLFCFHPYMVKGKPFGDFSVSIQEWDGLRPYHCVKCKKVKYYGFYDRPINRI